MNCPAAARLGGCQGQAATEFTVIASFVLVPLFLLIPLVGKYIDIKQAAVQQARFEAWEYTAWYGQSGQDADLMQNLRSDQRAARRDFVTTRGKGNQLFFSDIAASDYKKRTEPGQAAPPPLKQNQLWVDHHGDTLFNVSTPDSEMNDAATPDPTSGVINKVIGLIELVTKTFGKIMKKSHLNGDAEFDALRNKGYFTSTFQVDVRASQQVVADISSPATEGNTSMKIAAKAAVLARGWTAGSTDNAVSESNGLILTSLISKPAELFNDVIDTLQRLVNIASHVMPIEIKLPHGPQFGPLHDGDLMPYEHLLDDTRKAEERHGLYYYKD